MLLARMRSVLFRWCWLIALAFPLSAADELFRRVVVPAAGSLTIAVDLDLAKPTTLRAITSECPCVQPVEALPLALLPPRSAIILRVAGALPGVKSVDLHTDAGVRRLTVQVVSDGLGEGRAILAALESRPSPGAPTVVVHDLRGSARNCGCSDGSLGGIGRLSRLPKLIRATIPHARFVLTGDAVGDAPAVAQALVAVGWRTGADDLAIAVDATVAQSLIADPRIALIIAGPTVRLNHRKLVHPVLDRGMTATVVLGDGTQVVLPIDRSLPDDPDLERRFAGRAIGEAPMRPGDACISCHASAHQTWSGSAHARPWAGLPAADRVEGCVECHGIEVPVAATPGRDRTMAGGVHCQSCHQGSDAHAGSNGTTRTSGTVGCISCHDAKHDPGFDRIRAWLGIAHTRESAAK